MAEEEKSEGTYAAFCNGTDEDGTWLWCDVGHNVIPSKPFYADVNNGAFQVKYEPAGRLMTVVATKQIVTGIRLAGIGHVPRDVFKQCGGHYNDIIEYFLRSGFYRKVEYFCHDVS